MIVIEKFGKKSDILFCIMSILRTSDRRIIHVVDIVLNLKEKIINHFLKKQFWKALVLYSSIYTQKELLRNTNLSDSNIFIT